MSSARVHWLETAQGNRILSAFVPLAADNRTGGSGAAAPTRRLTLLYSHGNAVDLGQMLPTLR